MNKLINKYLNPTLYVKKGSKLIPKALFGTGLFKKGLNWISNHMAPTRELTLFEVQNNARIEKEQKQLLQKKKQPLLKEENSKITSIKNLQKELKNKGFYKGEIDGKMGNLMRAAITVAATKGYEVKDDKLVRKKLKKENREHLLNNKGEGIFSLNNPLLRSIQDFFLARTHISEKSYPTPYTSTIHVPKKEPKTITSIPIELEAALQELIKFKGSTKKGNFTSNDWKALQSTYTGGNRSVFKRNFGALASIEHTLGQFGWETNEKGEIIVKDAYDWNVGSTSKDQGWYTSVRDFMGKFGTKSNAPDDEKTKYEINLGKPENW